MKFPKLTTVYLEKLFFFLVFLNFFGAFRNCIDIPICVIGIQKQKWYYYVMKNEKQHGKYNKEYI